MKGYKDREPLYGREEGKSCDVKHSQVRKGIREIWKTTTAILPFSSFLSCSLQKFSPGHSKQGGSLGVHVFTGMERKRKMSKESRMNPPFTPEVGQDPWPPSLALKH